MTRSELVFAAVIDADVNRKRYTPSKRIMVFTNVPVVIATDGMPSDHVIVARSLVVFPAVVSMMSTREPLAAELVPSFMKIETPFVPSPVKVMFWLYRSTAPASSSPNRSNEMPEAV
jgi:hypothetical protein